ncbi:MAG: dynamin family protein [Chroococcidiopsis sp.]
MTVDVETILCNTQSQLKKLGEAIENLVATYPDVFDAAGIREKLDDFRQSHREAVDRLKTPNFSIATIGTTSSGKSTIVNALIGRKVAPIEAGEMSGGILTLQHSNERKLVVEETEGATWETGTWSELSDEALYDRIRNGIMLPYHDTRKKKDCMAPRVSAFVPLLPASDRNLLGLPPGVGIELIDLPGLKSIQDRDNLKVIQERVHKAFSLVALDYMQVDDQHRKRLLEELKRVVQYLQGRTDSMIFILNRVDQRGADDIAVSERIDRLREEIQETLSLKELPEILPFNARLLYYAQCAWGAMGMEHSSLVDGHARLKLIDAMLEDCAGAIRQHVSDNRDLRRWFRDLEDRVCDRENISDETMRQLLQYALEWSGGSKLWSRLCDRLQKAFPELVLLPALIDVFDNYDSLAATIDHLADIRKLDKQEEIEAQQAEIKENHKRFREGAVDICDGFRTETKTIIEDLKKNDPGIDSKLAQQAVEKGRQGFQLLFDAIREVEADLTQVLIAPVRDAIKNNQGAYELEENLCQVITPVMANDIARAYDLVSRKLNSFTYSSNHLIRRVREDDRKGIREIEHAERAVRLLYQAMREALTRRAEFTLQAQVKQLETALLSWVEEQKQELYNLCLQEIPSLKLDEVIFTDFKKKLSSNPPVLPEKFFELAEAIEQRQIKQEETVRQNKETEYYTTGSCFKSQHSRTVTRDIKGIVEYCELSLPNADMMSQQWAEGIAKGKPGLWDNLCTWLIERLDWTSSVFDESVDNVIQFAENALKEQMNILKQYLTKEINIWNEIEVQKDLITEIYQNLKKQSRTHPS